MTFLTELKARPQEERAAFASMVAVVVVVMLMIAWAVTLVLRGNLAVGSGEVKTQTASAAASLNEAVDKTSDAINQATAEYKELQGKIGAVGAKGYATSTIEEASRNFMKIRYDKDGNMYIEDENEKSLLNEAAGDIPDVLDFPY